MKIKSSLSVILTIIVLSGATILSACSTRGADAPDQKFAVPEIPFAPKTYVIYKSSEKIKVDGKLDETIWNKARWTDDFVNIRGGQAPEPGYNTRVKLLWDEEFLYVGAELEEEHLWATMTERDAPLYQENALEVFIDPDGDTHNYLEFQINARETIWDLYLNKPYRDGGFGLSGWNLLDYRGSVHLNGEINEPEPKDKKWTVELAFPMRALSEVASNGSSPAGKQWRVNFSRAQRQLEVVDGKYRLKVNPDTGEPYKIDFWTWSPLGLRDIHYPEMWGYVQFSDIIAGDGTEEFTPHPEEHIKWALRQVYYQLRQYHLDHGRYTDDMADFDEEVHVEGTDIKPEISVGHTTFEVSASGYNSETTWYINQEGRVWKE